MSCPTLYTTSQRRSAQLPQLHTLIAIRLRPLPVRLRLLARPMSSSPSSPPDWARRWDEGLTGWKNEEMARFWERDVADLERLTGLKPGARVLVPLSGDSPVVRHLVARGYAVTAVEFVEKAANALVAGLEEATGRAAEEVSPGTRRLAGDGPQVEVVQGDFFAYTPDENAFNAVYDRASLVAIEPDRRDDYIRVVDRGLGPGGAYYLTVFWDPERATGPPYCLSPDHVRALFTPARFNEVSHEDCGAVPRGLGHKHRYFFVRK